MGIKTLKLKIGTYPGLSANIHWMFAPHLKRIKDVLWTYVLTHPVIDHVVLDTANVMRQRPLLRGVPRSGGVCSFNFQFSILNFQDFGQEVLSVVA